MRRHIEREAKFVLADGAALPTFDVGPTLPISDVRLTATYWDTPDRRLLSFGHTLRYRSSNDGTEGRWTLKLAPGIGMSDDRGQGDADDLMNRSEIDVDGAADGVPDTVRALLAGAVGSEALAPVATIVTDRRRIVVTDADGRPLVEVADDTVAATPTGGAAVAFHEIEVEQLDAADDDGAAIVSELVSVLKDAGARRQRRNKLQVSLGVEPRRHDGPHRLDDATVGGLVRATIAAGTARLISNDPHVRLGDDAAAVHQARVATRRLRSDLRSLRHVLDGERVDHLRAELAWLAQLLGGVRDLDVLRLQLVAHGHELEPVDAEGLAEILAALDDERRARQAELVDALDSGRYAGLLDQLAVAADAPPLAAGTAADDGAGVLSGDIVHIAWRRTARAVARLGDQPSPVELHEIRRRIKRVRYASELAAQVHGRRARRFAARLATVQDSLGAVHDAHVAQQWLREVAEHHQLTIRGAFVAGRLAERERRRADTAAAAWRADWHTAARPKQRRWLDR